jgi:hypothetical protein
MICLGARRVAQKIDCTSRSVQVRVGPPPISAEVPQNGIGLTNASQLIRPPSHSDHIISGGGALLYFLCYNVATVLS